MLNIGKLVGESSATYYLEKVASGIEDYYIHAGEAPGRWVSAEAGHLGLSGEVAAEHLVALLRGDHPRTGERLAPRQRAADRMWGWDLTFRAPKSVSLLFALGTHDVPTSVRTAHDRAVGVALAYLEREACFGRRRVGGEIRPIPAQGFVAAAFQHRTSRAGDPLLHTHVLTPNLVRGVDGRWGAIDGRLLYRHAKTAGALYESELRTQLSARLGVAWTPVRNGLADVLGVPPTVIRAFSRRRQEITAHMAARGETSARAAQTAALETRKGKDRGRRPEGLVAEWRARAASLGFGPAALTAVMRRRASGSGVRTPAETIATLLDPDGLTAHASSFSRRDVVLALCDRLPAWTPAFLVESLADLALGHPDVVDLSGREGPPTLGAGRRHDDGRVVPGPDERRFSTREMLALEQRLIDRAAASRGGGAIARPDAVAAALDRRPALSDEQVAMCRRLLLCGDALQVARGHAGTGKTHALDGCREAWTASGLEVIGSALSARAAAELEAGAGIASSTLHRLLHELDPPPATGSGALGRPMLPLRTLGSGTVVVVDEAGMVGTRQLARLIDRATQAGATVVLVGDDHQLPEIDAGGAFRGLANRLGAVELTDNRRQVEAWEPQALRMLREGRPAEALAAYDVHDRVVTGASAIDLRAQMVEDWWRAREDHGHVGGDVVMVAHRRVDVMDLNRLAHARRVASGAVTGQELHARGGSFAVGDEVLCRRNSRALGVLNGSRGVVAAVDVARQALTVCLDEEGRGGGTAVTLPAEYVHAGHVTHGYAMTAHSAQGATASRALVLIDGSAYREWGYVALSRGRWENRLYIAHCDRAAGVGEASHGLAPRPEPAVAEAVRALAASRAQLMASDLPGGRPVESAGGEGAGPAYDGDRCRRMAAAPIGHGLGSDGGASTDAAARQGARL